MKGAVAVSSELMGEVDDAILKEALLVYVLSLGLGGFSLRYTDWLGAVWNVGYEALLPLHLSELVQELLGLDGL